jgi:hypothetical protein
VLCKIFGRVGAGRCWESSVLSRSRPIWSLDVCACERTPLG